MSLIDNPQLAYRLEYLSLNGSRLMCRDRRIYEPYDTGAGDIEVRIGTTLFTTDLTFSYFSTGGGSHPDNLSNVGVSASMEMQTLLSENPGVVPEVWVRRRQSLQQLGTGTSLPYLGIGDHFGEAAFLFGALPFERDWSDSGEDLLIGSKYFWCPNVYLNHDQPSPTGPYTVYVVNPGPTNYAADPDVENFAIEFYVPDVDPGTGGGGTDPVATPWEGTQFVMHNQLTVPQTVDELIFSGTLLSGGGGGISISLTSEAPADVKLNLVRPSGEHTILPVVAEGTHLKVNMGGYVLPPATSVMAYLSCEAGQPTGIPAGNHTASSLIQPTEAWLIHDLLNPASFTAVSGLLVASRHGAGVAREVLDPQLLPGFHDAEPGDLLRVNAERTSVEFAPAPSAGGEPALYQPLDYPAAQPAASAVLKPGWEVEGRATEGELTIGSYSMDPGSEHQGMMVVQRFRVLRPTPVSTLRLDFMAYWEATDPALATGVNGLQVVLVGETSGVIADTSELSIASTSVGTFGSSDRADFRQFADVLVGSPYLQPGEVYTLLLSARQSQAWLDVPYARAQDMQLTNIVPEGLFGRYPEAAGDRYALTHTSDYQLDGVLLFELGQDLPRPAQQVLTGAWAYGAETTAPVYSHAAGRMVFPAGGPGGDNLDSASGPEAEARYSYMHHPAIPSVMGDIRKPFISDVAPQPLVFEPNGGALAGEQPTMQIAAIHVSHPGGVPLNGLRLSGAALAAVQAQLDAQGDYAVTMQLYDTTVAARHELEALWRPEYGSVPLYHDGVQQYAWKRASEIVQTPDLLIRQAPWMRPGRTYLILLYAVPIYFYGSPYDRSAALPIWPTSGAGVSGGNAALAPQVAATWLNLSGARLPEYLHFGRGLPDGVEVLAGGGKKDVLGAGGGGGVDLTGNAEGYFAFESEQGGGEVVARAQHEALVGRVVTLEEAPPAVVTQEQVDAAVNQDKVDAAVTQAKMDEAARRLLLPGAVLIEGLPYALPDAQPVNLTAGGSWSQVLGGPALNDGSPLRAMDDTLTLRPPGALLYETLALYRFGTATPKQNNNANAITDSIGRVLRQPMGLARDPGSEELVIRWGSAFQQEIAGQAGPSDYKVRLTGDGGSALREWTVTPIVLGGFVETRLTIADLGPLPLSAALEIEPVRLSALRSMPNLTGYYDVNFYPYVYAAKSGAMSPVLQATLDGQPATDEQVISGTTYTRQTGLADYTFRLSNLPNVAPTLTEGPDGLRVQGQGGLTYLNLPTAARPGTVRKLVLTVRVEAWHPDHPGALVLGWSRNTLEGLLSTVPSGGMQLTRTGGQYRLGSAAVPTGHIRFEVTLTSSFSGYDSVLRAYDADTGVLLATQTSQVSAPENSPAASLRFLITPAYALMNGGATRLDLPAETYTIERWTEWSE